MTGAEATEAKASFAESTAAKATGSEVTRAEATEVCVIFYFIIFLGN